jgi:acyl-CoA thioesterase I
MKINKPAKIKLLITILLITASSITAHAQSNNTNNGNTIVCLGDSSVSGYSATVAGRDDKSKSWPAFLQKKVNIPVINAGVAGNTTAQGLARVKRDVLSKNPIIVIISLGGNDYFQKIPLATTKNNYQKIIDMVNDGNRKIYIIGRRILNEDPLFKDTSQYIDMIETLASSNNIEVIVDIWEGVWGLHMAADGVHANAKGLEIVADNIFNALKPYLEANNLLK